MHNRCPMTVFLLFYLATLFLDILQISVSSSTCVQAGRHSLTYFSTPACLTPEPYRLSSFKSLPAPAAGS